MTLTLSEQIKSHQNLQARQMRSAYIHLVARAAEGKQVAKDAEVAADLLPRLNITLEKFEEDILLRKTFVNAASDLKAIDQKPIHEAKRAIDERIAQHDAECARINAELAEKTKILQADFDAVTQKIWSLDSATNSVARARRNAGDLVLDAE